MSEETTWWPSLDEWNPEISENDWLELLKDSSVFTDKSLSMLKKFLDCGGKATCADLAKKYGGTANSYIGIEQGLASRILKKENITPISDGKREWKFPILFLGRYVDKEKDENDGSYIWKLRPELEEALKKFNIFEWDMKYHFRKLIEDYKILIKQSNYTDFIDDEMYKWKFITENQKSKPLDIVNYLIKNNLNIFDRVRVSQGWKVLLKDKPNDFEQIIQKLSNENIPTHQRLQNFKGDMSKLFDGYNFSSHANDERTAACFLACFNPQKYTLYKDENLYAPLCKYLGLEKAKADYKLEHFHELVNVLAGIIKEDSELQEIFKSKTEKAHYIQSDLLIAQTVVWCVFEERAQKILHQEFTNWILPCNPTKFDIDGAYKEFSVLNWKQGKNKFSVGDTVFIYVSGQNGSIRYMAKVTKTDLQDYEIDDSKYQIDASDYKDPPHIEIEFRGKYDGDALSFEKLKNNGLSSSLQGAVKITDTNLLEYIKSFFEGANTMNNIIPLNQILYGPPGTGKTYATKAMAVKICENFESNNRKDINDRYNDLVKKGRIVFTTFHQSMSYEDFIEGIKPITKDDDGEELDTMKYKVVPGIFKQICEDARKSSQINGVDNFDECWDKLMTYLNDKEFLDIPLLTGNSKIKIIQNETGTGLMTDEDRHKYFSKEQLYNIYQGKKGVPAGGHDNYRRAIVKYMKDDKANIGLLEYKIPENTNQKLPYLLIIDEINRGNIPQIFGELITLIEDSKREGSTDGLSVKLPYSGENFSVPSNLYILGTMNTADRSIEALDTALRRRFTFVEMMPKPDKLGIVDGIDLQKMLTTMNDRLEYLLDRDHTIGHAYFINAKNAEDVKSIFKEKIIPQLQEYFYSDWKKIQLILGESFIKECKLKSAESIFGSYLPDEYIDVNKKSYEICFSDDWDFSLPLKVNADTNDQ